MRSVRAVAAMLVVVGLSACDAGVDQATAKAAPEVLAAAVARGEQLFVASCAACHGCDGAGIRGLGSDMRKSAFVARLDDDKLVSFIKRGRPASDLRNESGIDMPPMGGNPALTDEELRMIVAHIRSIQSR